MRTTVTLDPDVEALLRTRMRERGLSFKEALNSALRRALTETTGAEAKPYRLRTYRMGFRPGIDIDRALALAAADEDVEIERELSSGK